MPRDPRPSGQLNTPGGIDRVPLLLLVVDVLAVVVACLLVPTSALATLLLICGVTGAFQSKALYKSRLTLSLIDDLPLMAAGVVAAAAVTSVVVASTSDVSVWMTVLEGGVTLALLLVGRAATYGLVRTLRRRGLVAYRTLIVGTGPTAERVARTLEEHPEHGLRVVGFVGPRLDLPGSVRDGIVADNPSELGSVTVKHDVAVVIVTYLGAGARSILKSLRMRDVQRRYSMFLVPPLFQMLHSPERERIRDIALIKLRPAMSQLLQWRAKRLIDIAVAALALIVLSPVLVLTALAVRLDTGRGILFRQIRVGRGGQLFTLYKFRSLQPADSVESATSWSVGADARVGAVGRFIRRTSLDELPQLLNILRGDMSLVGPRPERPHFVEKFNTQYDSYPQRHRVRPGLTGWAAVNGLRGDTSIEERAYFDNVYIDNWSLWLDLKIMARTFSSVFGGRGS